MFCKYSFTYNPYDGPVYCGIDHSICMGESICADVCFDSIERRRRVTMKRRRRRSKFVVPDSDSPGTTIEIITHGLTPDQLFHLMSIMRKNPLAKDIVDSKLKDIGYNKLQYLTAQEAEELINRLDTLE